MVYESGKFIIDLIENKILLNRNKKKVQEFSSDT